MNHLIGSCVWKGLDLRQQEMDPTLDKDRVRIWRKRLCMCECVCTYIKYTKISTQAEWRGIGESLGPLQLAVVRTINPPYIKMQIGFSRHYYQRASVIFANAGIYLIYVLVCFSLDITMPKLYVLVTVYVYTPHKVKSKGKTVRSWLGFGEIRLWPKEYG